MYIIIVGCGSLGSTLANELSDAGHNVSIIDRDSERLGVLGSGFNGFKVKGIEFDNDTLKINDDYHYPMQSVFEFPIALAVLSEIDKKNISFEQEIKISKKDLLPKTWSPIKDKFPNGTILTVKQILEYTISQSDNIGCDILLELIGGTDSVDSFLKAYNFRNISIKANEELMRKDWSIQYQNWTTPSAMNKLLIDAYNNTNQMLSQKSYDYIWKVMRETTTGSNRLKGQLPKNTVVAHKTGTSGTNNGITAATNDVGVIILPDGQIIFISVFVADSFEAPEINEKIISDISKLAWDYYK
jgi:beta-lactamase class A VEB